MGIFCSDHFVLPLPEGHRFPMQKYALTRQRVVVASDTLTAVLHASHGIAAQSKLGRY